VRLTAKDADQLGRRFAGWLAARSAVPGDRVVLALPGGTDLIAAACGALRAGVIPVILDPATPPGELSELIADAEPVVALRDAGELAVALHSQPVGPAADADLSPVLLGRPMHYTSGTTGRRKGVWSGVLSEPDAAALWGEEQQLWNLSPDDVHIVMSPLYHSAPLRFAIATVLFGGTVIYPGTFSVERFLAACAEQRPSTTFTAPAQLIRLREAAQHDADVAGQVRSALGGFRLLAHAGAPCPDPVKRWLLDLLDGQRVWEFYGSTEGQFTACSGDDWRTHPTSVGKARPGRTLSLDPDGRIWCVVPDHARFEYWRDPVKTAAAWRVGATGSVFTVGDVGQLDAEGYLSLVGRRDDLIISGGVNVYPAEVERVLATLPGVLEVAVFGVPDDRWGQRVEAAVRGPVDPADLLVQATDLLPPARRPKRVHIVEDLPRTATGKILRRELPGLFADEAQTDH
jgi:long-chain acyl-CoA synthetase